MKFNKKQIECIEQYKKDLPLRNYIGRLARKVIEQGSKQMIYEKHLKKLGIRIIRHKGGVF